MSTMIVPTVSSRRHSLPRERPVEDKYLPESDGRPMSETDLHRKLMIALLHALEEHFRHDSQVYVSGNIFVYYRDENGKRQPVSPDILVVFGVEKKDRRVYKVEEEGQVPGVVIELTSSSTKIEDFGTKRYIYAYLGVKEYFLFDPYGETGRQALQGFQLEGGEYVPRKEFRQKSAMSLHSEVLGLELRVEQGTLRLYDPKTGARLRTPEETEAELHAAASKAAAAEAEAARLRKELAKLRGRKS